LGDELFVLVKENLVLYIHYIHDCWCLVPSPLSNCDTFLAGASPPLPWISLHPLRASSISSRTCPLTGVSVCMWHIGGPFLGVFPCMLRTDCVWIDSNSSRFTRPVWANTTWIINPEVEILNWGIWG
jgi:hypothetical protein